MGLEDREWRLIREESRPGAVQMSLDEIGVKTAAAVSSRRTTAMTASMAMNFGSSAPIPPWSPQQ